VRTKYFRKIGEALKQGEIGWECFTLVAICGNDQFDVIGPDGNTMRMDRVLLEEYPEYVTVTRDFAGGQIWEVFCIKHPVRALQGNCLEVVPLNHANGATILIPLNIVEPTAAPANMGVAV
jgi:hypothetical protein